LSGCIKRTLSFRRKCWCSVRVKIIKHMCVPFEGHDYTQADGEFDLPDGIARKLIDGGTCAEVVVEDSGVDEGAGEGDGDGEGALEAHELLALLPASRTDALCAVLDEAGYTTAASVLEAEIEDLTALRGIGEKTAEVMKNAAFAFVNGE